MYKRILVPVDGSVFSELVVPHAALIARTTGAELALLRIVEKAQQQQEAAAEVEKLASGTGATAICTVAQGDVAATIHQEADRVDDTLVMLSSHGRTGAMQAIFGSVAREVLHHSSAPLLIYRPDPDNPPVPAAYRHVILPLDGSALSESMIPHAAALAKWLGTDLIVVSAVEPNARIDPSIPRSDVMESGYVHLRADDIAARHGVKTTWEVLHGDPDEAIPQFVRGTGDSLLAMTTHDRTALQTAFAGSVTGACLREAGVPVFTRLP